MHEPDDVQARAEALISPTELKLREHTRQMALATGRDPQELWEELTARQSTSSPQLGVTGWMPAGERVELRRREGDQQLPTIDPSGVCVQDEVIAYIERRKAVGIERYGTVLQPHNGRDALRDLFDELTDGINYLAQVLIERDGELPGAGSGNRVSFEALTMLARNAGIGFTFEWFPVRDDLEEFANVTLDDASILKVRSFTGTIAECIEQACAALRPDG